MSDVASDDRDPLDLRGLLVQRPPGPARPRPGGNPEICGRTKQADGRGCEAGPGPMAGTLDRGHRPGRRHCRRRRWHHHRARGDRTLERVGRLTFRATEHAAHHQRSKSFRSYREFGRVNRADLAAANLLPTALGAPARLKT